MVVGCQFDRGVSLAVRRIETFLAQKLPLPDGYRDILINITSFGSGLGNPSLAESLSLLLRHRFSNASVNVAADRDLPMDSDTITKLEELLKSRVVDYQGGTRHLWADLQPGLAAPFIPPSADVSIYIGWPSPYLSGPQYQPARSKLHFHLPLHFAENVESVATKLLPTDHINISAGDSGVKNSGMVPDIEILKARVSVFRGGIKALICLRREVIDELCRQGVDVSELEVGANWTLAYSQNPEFAKSFVKNLTRQTGNNRQTVLFLFRGGRSSWTSFGVDSQFPGIKIVSVPTSLSNKPLIRKLWATLGTVELPSERRGALPALVTGDSSFVEALCAGVPVIHDGVDGPSEASGFRRMSKIFSGPLAFLGEKYNPGCLDVLWRRLFDVDPYHLAADWGAAPTEWLLRSDVSRLIAGNIWAHSKGRGVIQPGVLKPPSTGNLDLSSHSFEELSPPSCTDLGFFWRLYKAGGPSYYPSLIRSAGVEGRAVVDAFLAWNLVELGHSDSYKIELTSNARRKAREIAEVFLRHGLWSDISSREPIDPRRIALCEDLSSALRG